jgi:hypothetical protein
MCGGAQRPHVELVCQDLEEHSILPGALRLQRPCLGDDCVWRGPSAGIPGAQRFQRDTKGRRAFRL